jgi:hypothetical protein
MMIMLLLLAAAAPPHAVSFDRGAPGLEFHYGWPAAADALPALRARLQAEMARDRREALAALAESRRIARQNHFELVPQDYSKDWEVAGDSAPLLSLTANLGAFSGGAHPNTIFYGLIWDRRGNRALGASAVLGRATLARMRDRFCRALDRERASRREDWHPEAGDPFLACPPYAEMVLAPVDKDGDRRFETLSVLIAPYIAGPYVEGEYLIELPFDAGDVAAIPAGWRAAFEPARRRR